MRGGGTYRIFTRMMAIQALRSSDRISISRYTAIDSLTRPVVVELIDNVKVSEKYEVDGQRHQNILINYKFAGNLCNEKIAEGR